MRIVASYLIGLVFGTGLTISGMINPAKVLNFFDIFGTWDPSLAFVMGGALLTTLVGYRLVLGRSGPLLETKFRLPTLKVINGRLVFGAALFGIGWGITGFCPGGSIPALGTGRYEVAIFTAALIVGMILTNLLLGQVLRPAKSS
jgi:uncharacterized membrane protein YedE/YeeE